MKMKGVSSRSVVLSLVVVQAAAFTLPAAPLRLSTKLHAVGVLARKAKEAEAARLRKQVEADEADPVGQALRGASIDKAEHGRVKAALTKANGTLSILCEYHRKLPAALRANGVEEYEIPEVTFVSKEVRSSGASVMALNMDKTTGGCSLEDFEAARLEQFGARSDYPGSLPLIWADIVVDEVQLAQAFVAGAAAVTLPLEAIGLDRCEALQQVARDKYGLESVIVCAPKEEGAEALKALLTEAEKLKPGVVCVFGCDADTAIEARAAIGPDTVAMARVVTRADKGLDEAEDAWALRDAGYNAVWASDVLYKFGTFSGALFTGSPESIQSVIKAMKSKASRAFARASGSFSGRGEGAKEYLGDIMM